MRLGRLLLLLLFVCVAALAYLALAPETPPGETFVDIPPGVGTVGIAMRLEAAGVIRSAWLFAAMRRVHGGTLRAGEYRFAGPETLAQVFARIARGDVFTRPLLVPEGFNLFDIAHAAEHAGLCSAPDFLAAARRDTALIADLSPRASSLEGFLFPDTYSFSRHTGPDGMVAAMVRRFRDQTAALGPDLRGSQAVQTVTLASLIEKEVHVDAERRLVAGVFRNRLAHGMPLATDPAVIYAAQLDGRWRGTIHASDLRAPSPFNTYLYPGLPPGPIANPGLLALRAALHPADTDYLYFVADSQGHTRFSVDAREHDAQVAAYRAAGGR